MNRVVKLLAILFIGIILVGCGGYNNKEEVKGEVKISEVIFEYGSKELLRDKLPKEFQEYTKVRLPAIDTMSVQSALYDIDTEQGIKELRIIIEDTKAPSIKAPDEVTIKNKEELSRVITAEDPVDGEITVKIDGLDKLQSGDNELVIKATDKNGNTTEKKILVRYIMPDKRTITLVDLDGKRERIVTRTTTLGELLDELNKDKVKYVLEIKDGNRYIESIEGYEINKGNTVGFESENNTQCEKETFCPALDKLDISDGDIFTFSILKP